MLKSDVFIASFGFIAFYYYLMETSKMPNDHKNMRFHVNITIALNF